MEKAVTNFSLFACANANSGGGLCDSVVSLWLWIALGRNTGIKLDGYRVLAIKSGGRKTRTASSNPALQWENKVVDRTQKAASKVLSSNVRAPIRLTVSQRAAACTRYHMTSCATFTRGGLTPTQESGGTVDGINPSTSEISLREATHGDDQGNCQI